MVWLLLLLFADQFESAFQAGLIALNQNNLAVAESQLESASHMRPRDARVWLALTQTYWKEHKSQPAAEAAQKTEALATDAAILHGLAVYYSEMGDLSKTASLLQSALSRSAYDEGSYFDLAQLYLKQHDFASALKTLDAGRKNFDKSPQLELAAGVAYYGLRRFPEAIDAFLRTIQLDPGVPQPYTFLGRLADQAEDKLPRISAVFGDYAKRDPENYESNYLYGKALLIADNPAEAEPFLRKSIAENSHFAESHFELGVLLEQRGKFDEAAGEIRRAIELNPNDPVPHYRLARLYDRMGKPADARAERELHVRLSGGVK